MLLKSKAFALDLYQVGDDVDQIKVQIQGSLRCLPSLPSSKTYVDGD